MHKLLFFFVGSLLIVVPPLHADDAPLKLGSLQDLSSGTDPVDFVAETSLDHGVGVLKLITNNTSSDVLLRFADTAYPLIKPGGSTDDYGLGNKAVKLANIFGSTMLMGIIGVMAMKSNPQQKLTNMQERINKPSSEFSEKVDDEKERLTKIEKGEEAPEQDPAVGQSDVLKARIAAEKKWSDFIDKQRDQENDELEKKLKDPSITDAEKKKLRASAEKRQAERDKANEYQKRLGSAQREGGLINTLWSDKVNTKNEWFNEKSDFSREVNQWKGMTGRNTIQERESDRAFWEEGVEKMTPDEKKKALELRKQELADRKKITLDKEQEKKNFWKAARDQGGFTNTDGSAMSKGQMAKKVLWNGALGKGKKSGEASKERSNVARNLVLAGAAIGGISTAIAAVSEDMGTRAIESMIPWEIPDGTFRCPITRNPMLVGFGSTFVQNFGEGSILSIKRMMGVGGAWLQNPLPTPLNFTLKFKVRVNDAGGVHIMLREGLKLGVTDNQSLDFDTKILIGAFNNSVTAISDKGTIVAQIKKDQYPAAAVPPGLFTPYWLSYNNGFIMLGLGQPGDNVILSWNNPNPNPNLDHIGLSCDTSSVDFSEIFFSAPVVSQLVQKKYYANPNTQVALAQGTSWLGYSFREPGRGTIAFQKKGGPAVVSLAMSNEENAPRIKFTLGSEYDEPITICYKNSQTQELTEEQVGIISDPYPNPSDSFETYWISNLYGQFTVGHSQPKMYSSGSVKAAEPGTNMIACVTLPDFSEADTIGFGQHPDYTGTPTTIKNIAILPAAELNEDLPPGYVERRKFAGPLNLLYPFSYQFRQSGQSVEVRDTISGQAWFPAKTPQQMATYFFNAAIAKDGTLSMAEKGNSKNTVKFGIGAAATALQQSAGLVNQTATTVGQSGVDIITQIITAGTSVGLVGVATGINTAAGALSAEAKYGFRDQNAYVYTEKVKRQKDATTTVPEDVQASLNKIAQLIRDANGYKQAFQDRYDATKMAMANIKMLASGAFSTRSSDDRHSEQLSFFEQYVTSYKQIITLINHPLIGSNPSTKNNVFNALFFINQAVREIYTQDADLPQKQIMTETVINLFLDARQNPYLLNNRVSDDRNRAKMWSGWIQDLAGSALTSTPSQPFTLNPMFGEYLWFQDPHTLPMSQNGSVFFEAEGLNDIFVGLISDPQDVRNTEADVYEVVFGGNNNTKSFARIKSLGRSVVEIAALDNPAAALTPLTKETFWISIKDGHLTAGKGAWGEGKLLEWTDPYPISGVRYVGLSTWNSPVTFSSIYFGPAVEDLTPDIKQRILQRKQTQKSSADDQAKAALMKDKFDDLSQSDTLTNDDLTQNDFVKNDMLSYDMLSIPDLDELTHDILQGNIDQAAGGDPRKKAALAQAALAKKAAAAAAAKTPDQKPVTAAQKREALNAASMGSLGATFQEWKQLWGKGEKTKRLANWSKEKISNTRNFFKKSVPKSEQEPKTPAEAIPTAPEHVQLDLGNPQQPVTTSAGWKKLKAFSPQQIIDAHKTFASSRIPIHTAPEPAKDDTAINP